jgi:hypothetical protein
MIAIADEGISIWETLCTGEVPSKKIIGVLSGVCPNRFIRAIRRIRLQII